jgi:uncharacterized membrane protein
MSTTSAGDAAMADDYLKKSDEALERANKILERAILWGVIIALIALAIWITNGMLG